MAILIRVKNIPHICIDGNLLRKIFSTNKLESPSPQPCFQLGAHVKIFNDDIFIAFLLGYLLTLASMGQVKTTSMERAERTMLAVVGEGFGLKYCLGALSLTTGVTYIETQLIQ